MSHQNSWIAIGQTRRVDHDRAIVTLQSPDDRSDSEEGIWKNSKIVARSSRDHGAIEPRSGSFSGRIASRRPDDDRRLTRTKIMARSRPDRAENQAFFDAKLKLILCGIEATTHAPGSASTTPSNDAHDHFQ